VPRGEPARRSTTAAKERAKKATAKRMTAKVVLATAVKAKPDAKAASAVMTKSVQRS
jgi:hypothetical protein